MDDIWFSIQGGPSSHINECSDSWWERKLVLCSIWQAGLLQRTHTCPKVEQEYEIYPLFRLLSLVPGMRLLHPKCGSFFLVKRPFCSPRPAFLQSFPARWGPFFHFTKGCPANNSHFATPETLHLRFGQDGPLTFPWLSRYPLWYLSFIHWK